MGPNVENRSLGMPQAALTQDLSCEQIAGTPDMARYGRS